MGSSDQNNPEAEPRSAEIQCRISLVLGLGQGEVQGLRWPVEAMPGQE